ncbi:MAG: DUF996 domain-containing protein [Candidatus Bathyarchaeota archaeon]|nr:DUF996 domain-containing protein [Candidatus Termiticorpusculum sp.]
MSDTTISSKILAIIGSILICLSFIPILGVIGIILVFSGIKGLAEHYRDGDIYRHGFTGAIFGAIYLIFMAINEFINENITYVFVTDLINRLLNPNAYMFDIQSVLYNIYFLPFLLIIFVFNLLMAIYFGKVFQDLAKRSGERLFNVAKTMLLIGAILTIFFFVGLVLIYIAFIIAAIAFALIKTDINTSQNNNQQPSSTMQPSSTIPPSSTTPTTPLEAKYCPHCGSPVSSKSVFCSQCGNQI